MFTLPCEPYINLPNQLKQFFKTANDGHYIPGVNKNGEVAALLVSMEFLFWHC